MYYAEANIFPLPLTSPAVWVCFGVFQLCVCIWVMLLVAGYQCGYSIIGLKIDSAEPLVCIDMVTELNPSSLLKPHSMSVSANIWFPHFLLPCCYWSFLRVSHHFPRAAGGVHPPASVLVSQFYSASSDAWAQPSDPPCLSLSHLVLIQVHVVPEPPDLSVSYCRDQVWPVFWALDMHISVFTAQWTSLHSHSQCFLPVSSTQVIHLTRSTTLPRHLVSFSSGSPRCSSPRTACWSWFFCVSWLHSPYLLG